MRNSLILLKDYTVDQRHLNRCLTGIKIVIPCLREIKS